MFNYVAPFLTFVAVCRRQGPPAIEVPSGWKVEVEDGVSTFVNTTTGEKVC